jgi:ubiquitin carboxyl-terminal hydrolase 7
LNIIILERRLDEERLHLEAKKREREEQHLFLTAKVCHWRLPSLLSSSRFVQVITDDTFAQHEGFDLATFDEKNWPPSELPSFRVLKSETYSTFKSRVAQHFNYPESQVRLWVLVNRQNKTVRPDTHIPENEPALSMSFPEFGLGFLTHAI